MLLFFFECLSITNPLCVCVTIFLLSWRLSHFHVLCYVKLSLSPFRCMYCTYISLSLPRCYSIYVIVQLTHICCNLSLFRAIGSITITLPCHHLLLVVKSSGKLYISPQSRSQVINSGNVPSLSISERPFDKGTCLLHRKRTSM
jgi:hypothetical protein